MYGSVVISSGIGLIGSGSSSSSSLSASLGRIGGIGGGGFDDVAVVVDDVSVVWGLGGGVAETLGGGGGGRADGFMVLHIGG